MKFLIFIFLFTVPFLANGAVVFNEIMYDLPKDSGADKWREWIEIFNAGTEAVDLSGWRFFEGGTNHRIKPAVKGGSFSLPAGGYAVIADRPEKFSEDWPNFSGIVFDSSFSLKNSGESLVLKDGELNDIDSVDYSSGWGGGGDGNSLQMVGGKWFGAPPTPGARNFGAEGGEVSPVEQVGVQETVEKKKIVESASEPKTESATQIPVEKTRNASEPPPVNPSVELAAGDGAAKEPAAKEATKESKKNAKQTDELQKTVTQLQQEVARLKKDAQKRKQKEKTAGIKNENPAIETQTANAVSAIAGSPAGTAQNIASPANAGGSIWKWLLAVLGLGIFAGIGSIFIRRQGLS